jgi:anti-anti-sigma factor
MREGRVLYSDGDHVHVLRYLGDIRHPLAPSVSGFVDTLLEHFDGERLVVDLSEAEAIDSTNLGELARIASVLSERHGARAAIVSTREDIDQVLRCMAFDELFDISKEPVTTTEGEPIPNLPASREVSLQVILAAHRRLVEMSEDNRRQFGDVVRQLEQELDAPASRQPGPDQPG